jgi:predicted patatin/cPLA2 family phospholipase
MELQNLLNEYELSKSNNILIDKIIQYIIAYNYYMIDDSKKFVTYKNLLVVENELLNSYQEDLDYNILSRLLYRYPSIINKINKNHKDYQQLKELYEFLTI